MKHEGTWYGVNGMVRHGMHGGYGVTYACIPYWLDLCYATLVPPVVGWSELVHAALLLVHYNLARSSISAMNRLIDSSSV